MIRICTRDLFKKFAKCVWEPLDRTGFFAYFGVFALVLAGQERDCLGRSFLGEGLRLRESD